MFVMAALLLITSSASAYDVRSTTLGGVPYWEDAGDVNTWFGEIANYGDMIWINFAGLDGNEFNLAKNEDTFGTYFLSIGGDAGEKVGLGYGYSLDVVTLGFFFQMFEGVGDDGEDSKYDFGAGLDYDMGDTNIDFTFMMGKEGDDGDMGFGARAFYPWKDGVELIPAFGYESATDGDDDANAMFMGLGFAYTVNDDNSLILGFDYMKETENIGDDEFTDTTMPGFYVGLETDVNDWLTLRTSGKKSWIKDQDDAEEYPFAFMFGFGVHLGDFDLDFAFDETRILDTFNWFLGGPDGHGVYAVQIKYYF